MSHRHFVPHRRAKEEVFIHRVCEILHGTGNPTASFAHSWEGPQAEEAFAEAWRAHSCAWVRTVDSKIGTYLDRYHHTDFEITLCNGVKITVDVKASLNAKKEFIKENPGIERRVIIIVADRNASTLDIRKRTILGIEEFLRLTNKRAFKEMPRLKRAS